MPKRKLRGCYRLTKVKMEDLKKGNKFILLEGKNELNVESTMGINETHKVPKRFVYSVLADGSVDKFGIAGVRCDAVDLL